MSRPLVSLAASLLLVLCARIPTGLAGDWPQFRGPGGQAQGETPVPLKWSGETNLAWKAQLPGPGASSPIVYGDRVYVTCYSGFGTDAQPSGQKENLVRHLVCLNRKDGSEIWRADLKGNSPEAPYQGFMTQHGYASSTPATDGERIYLFLGTAGVVAIDLDGKEVWRTPVGKGTDGWGSATSVVLYGPMVIVNAAIESQSIVGLDKATGQEKWRVEIPRRSWSTPALVKTSDGRHELVASSQGKILGIDPATGKSLWSCDGIADYICPSVVAGEGVAYVTGGRRSEIVAVRVGGSGDVSKSHVAWRTQIGANVTTPLLLGSHLFGVSDRGIAYCVDAASGKIAYQARLVAGQGQAAGTEAGGEGSRRPAEAASTKQQEGEGKRETASDPGQRKRRGPGRGFGGFGGRGGRGGGFGGGLQLYASIVASGENLLAVTRTDGTFVLAADEHELKQLGQNRIESDTTRFDGTPAISDGQLFLRSNDSLYCISSAKP